MGNPVQNQFYFLRDWQLSLATLSEGTAVYVVVGVRDDRQDPERVFTDYVAATIWVAHHKKHGGHFRIDLFTLYRELGNEVSLLKPGVTGKNHRTVNCALKPLKSDRELEAVGECVACKNPLGFFYHQNGTKEHPDPEKDYE